MRTFFIVSLWAIAAIPRIAHTQVQELLSAEANAASRQLIDSEPCCGPISAAGQRVLAVLDHADVEHLWLPHQHVNWETGKPEASAPVYSSHCSAFTAAISKRLGVYMLRPPEHSPVLLASAQTAWFGRDAGRRAGWYGLESASQAQTSSNAGELVVVSYESPNPKKPGHIAIVRPSLKTVAALAEDGPEITQAGGENYTDSNVRTGFRHHADAAPSDLHYFAHVIPKAASKSY